MKLRLHIDGGVRGTTPSTTGGAYAGRASIGFVIHDLDGVIICSGGMLIGQATVNEAEYSGLISGLYNCHLLGAKEVEVYSDSKLIVGHMTGAYAVKAGNLMPYWREAQMLVIQIGKVSFTWVPREQNKLADRITEDYLGKR
jgi:probable phosphoglycerate mutase